MIKVSVVSTKELVKISTKVVTVVIMLVVIIGLAKYSKANFTDAQIDTKKGIEYLAEEITAMGKLDVDNVIDITPETILNSEYKVTKYITSRNRDSLYAEDAEHLADESQENLDGAEEPVDDGVQEVSTDVQTEVITSSYKESYNCQIEGVKIRNETDFNLNQLGITTNDVNINNKNVIIFHTHTCESYTPTENNKYEASGNYRTTDLTHSVARVGEELKKYLSTYGFNVIHDQTYHDYPAYTGSYDRSLKTVSKILESNDNTDIIIDLHRDAMSDETYAPKVKIGDEYVSQIMFVIGTNGSGLKHDNWKKNLEFAIKVQKKADEMYPGLCKPIILRDARYNQNLGSAAVIIEFGATGNTLEECEGASKYLAKVLESCN